MFQSSWPHIATGVRQMLRKQPEQLIAVSFWRTIAEEGNGGSGASMLLAAAGMCRMCYTLQAISALFWVSCQCSKHEQ